MSRWEYSIAVVASVPAALASSAARTCSGVPGETSLLALGVSFANHARQRLDQLREERLLVFEMLVERPGGHAGSLADPAQVRLLEPLFQKRRKAALQDALVRLLVVAVAHCSHLPPIIT